MMKTLALRPLDTLFFRDNRPFNQDDAGLADARSMFPPFPTVLAGAVRASIARANGWDGSKSTFTSHRALIGNGPFAECGSLRFSPPVLLKQSNDDASDFFEANFPCPLALLLRTSAAERGKLKFEEAHVLRPGDPSFACDLGGDACFPTLPPEDDASRFKLHREAWISREGLRQLLTLGRLDNPAGHVTCHDSIVSAQPRVGLRRDYAAHKAATGELYSAVHQRLKRNYALGVSYRWQDANRKDILPETESVFPLGSQHRAVSCSDAQRIDLTDILPGAECFCESDGYFHYLVVLLSPADLKHNDSVPELHPLPGELVSACTDRPLRFGGWDAVAGDRGETRLYHRAGTTFFMRVAVKKISDAGTLYEKLKDAQQAGLGDKRTTQIGCGAFAVGIWKPGGYGDG
ncbi:MAG: type III-B CRISPR module-associated Cmr3 family protein [Geminicoccaceae bacterium]